LRSSSREIDKALAILPKELPSEIAEKYKEIFKPLVGVNDFLL